jgi:putative ABC transport system ATP-binding protein
MTNLKIELEQVKVRVPGGRTLFSVQKLAIPFGRHLLIQGESGKGKTTFLHLLAGLFIADQGQVRVGEMNLEKMSDEERCDLRREKIGVIFQKLNLIDHMTVAENLLLTMPSGEPDPQARVREALRRVNLEGRENDRSSVLSLGEQQRVAVARVLAQRPQIILADEPTSSLDQKNADFVLAALKEAAKGKTLIVVSHDRRIENEFDQVLPFEDLR